MFCRFHCLPWDCQVVLVFASVVKDNNKMFGIFRIFFFIKQLPFTVIKIIICDESKLKNGKYKITDSLQNQMEYTIFIVEHPND